MGNNSISMNAWQKVIKSQQRSPKSQTNVHVIENKLTRQLIFNYTSLTFRNTNNGHACRTNAFLNLQTPYIRHALLFLMSRHECGRGIQFYPCPSVHVYTCTYVTRWLSSWFRSISCKFRSMRAKYTWYGNETSPVGP